MRNFLSLALLLLITFSLSAQKFKYKKGIIYADDKAVGKVVKTKANAGMANDYTVSNMQGDPLATASYFPDIPEDPNNNTVFYYKFEFTGMEEPAYLGVNKLGQEKSIAKYFVKYHLIKSGDLDPGAVQALIDKKGVEPPNVAKYELVKRNTSWPIELRKAGEIEQNGELIGTYKDLGKQSDGTDLYQFFHPEGVKIASVWFANGNNANRFIVETYKDNVKQTATFNVTDNITLVAAIDRNYYALKRFIPWLIENKYM
jgi:uncharacterized protein YkuJ